MKTDVVTAVVTMALANTRGPIEAMANIEAMQEMLGIIAADLESQFECELNWPKTAA